MIESARLPHQEHAKKTILVNGRRMAYVELGDPAAQPILFLHGNPTSSYLWRNVMPYLAEQGRCIAPDLIGMGDSDKLPDSGVDSYRFVEHRQYLDAFIEALKITEYLTLVIHDWGSALGFDWARRHPSAIKGIAYMEAIVQPVTWETWPEMIRPIFQGMRSEAGESMVLEKNVFIEKILPGSILRDLSEEEMAIYRRPFLDAGEGRRPTLTWPRQIPISGEPEDVHQIVADYATWMAENEIPKLFVNAKPGAILTGEMREACRRWKNQSELTVAGSHFIQEDSAEEIGQAVSSWLQGLD